MATAGENSLPPIGALLNDGITQFQNSDVTFTKYVKVTLPLDGYVFWVKAGILTDTTYMASGATNVANAVKACGAVHYMSSQHQDQETNYSENEVVFTTTSQLTDFNELSPAELYIGIFDGIKFCFQTQGMYSPASKLYHYSGTAVLSYMASQIIDDINDLDTDSLIVSNSLPLFLAMNSYTNNAWDLFTNPVTLYPSFLVPTNAAFPYGSVHNDPENITALNLSPMSRSDLTTDQFVSETVEVTLYGLNNLKASNFVNFVREYAVNNGYFGLSNIPVVRDEKINQDELSVIGQKKSVVFTLNYYQSAVRSVSRQLITSAIADYNVTTLTT